MNRSGVGFNTDLSVIKQPPEGVFKIIKKLAQTIFEFWYTITFILVLGYHKLANWVFSYWVTILRHGFFFVGAWQLDILVAPMVFKVRDERFYFLYGSLSNWEVYTLFFTTLAIGFFIPDIIKIIKWFRRYFRLNRKV